MPNATPQLADVLLGAAASEPERLAATGAGALTYGELERRVAATAADVREVVAIDDRIALVAGNEVAFLVAYLATLRAGCVAVLMNATSPADELDARARRGHARARARVAYVRKRRGTGRGAHGERAERPRGRREPHARS